MNTITHDPNGDPTPPVDDELAFLTELTCVMYNNALADHRGKMAQVVDAIRDEVLRRRRDEESK